METAVTFRSTRFRPALPEECQVNPGRYGAELAYWLCSSLADIGIITSYPNYEDWGWFIEYTAPEGDEFWLCCGNVEGADDLWHCFLQPKSKGFLRRSAARTERALPLVASLRRVLEDEVSVSEIEWEEGN